MWSKYQTSILVAISISLLLSMFWFMQSLALSIFISLLLTILLSPLVDKLARKKVPRTLGAAIVLCTFIAAITSFLLIVSKTFLPAFSNFIADIPRIADSLKSLPLLHTSPFITEQLDALFKNFSTFGMTALKSSIGIIFSIFSKLLDLIVTVFVTFYLLKDGKSIKTYAANLFPHQDRARIMILLNNILTALSSYIRGQIVICIITGILVFAYFSLRGLPYASVFAVLSAIGEFIPVIGPTIASLFGTLLACTESPVIGTQTLLFYILLTQTNHNIIYPFLIGKSLNLHPIAIMLGILFGGELLGAIGMFLAVPCMVIIKLVIEDIFNHRTDSIKN